MMNELIARFPAQLKEALEIGNNSQINEHRVKINKVYVSGIGGSGIGGDFVSEFVREECPIPYIVGKGYTIPQFVDKHTLAIVSSYSGNTEETLNAFSLLKSSGAKIVVISSGGRLIREAKENGLDYIKVADKWPSPRACLGYSIVQQLFVLLKLGFISQTAIDNVHKSIDLLMYNEDEIKKEAKLTANRIHDKLPIIYTTSRMEAVALRLRQQINENAKKLCWHNVIPEMNHNELVGWRESNKNLAVIYLRNKDDYKRNQVRIEINKKIISKYTDTIIELYSKGTSFIEKSFYLVHLGDWISWYVSQNRGVDAIEVDIIDYLKSELSKI